MFIGVQTPVYEGMIIGESPKIGDIAVNPARKNTSPPSVPPAPTKPHPHPPKIMGLEEAIEFIAEDELMEVTPKSIRLRKRILDTATRLKAQAKLKK